MRFAIVRTGIANVASVKAAFKRLGIETYLVESPDELEEPDAVVLPGVGAFGAGVEVITSRGWSDLFAERFANDQPTLAICLGMQLLCQESAEATGEQGLGILPAKIEKFPDSVVVPQFGWNQVVSNGKWFKDGYVYFANSYYLPVEDQLVDSDWELLTANHGVDFVAAAARGNWLACQFHPELSGDYGLNLLKRWVGRFSDRDLNESKSETLSC